MKPVKVLAVALVALAGCGGGGIDEYSCDNPDVGHKDPNGRPDPCHYRDPDGGDAGDAGDADPPDAGGETCDGQCVPAIPNQWFGPSFVWMGAEAKAPPCPARAPVEGYTGHGDLSSVPPLCGACACSAPSGSCAAPATLTAAAASCAGDGSSVMHTSFDPSATWGGTCTAANAIPSGKLCGGVPCVQSITIAPLTLEQSGCLPIEPINITTPPTWGTFARACVFGPPPLCEEFGRMCVPPVAEPDFKLCISRSGDPTKPALECPSSYPLRSVFHDELIDDRTCSPCTCDAPAGSTCTGSISVFKDGACGASLVVSLGLDATGPKCSDVSPGVALGSKSASEPIYSPGTCAPSGGVQNGSAVPDGATVFCCRETP